MPLPVELLFHLAYVTGWAVIFVVLLRRSLIFLNALWLGLALWIVAILVFFPIIGWGPLGFAVGPKLIVEIGLTPGDALIAAVIQVFPDRACGDQQDWFDQQGRCREVDDPREFGAGDSLQGVKLQR
ncbi:MAG: hypothetical protein IH940_04945, partial [Acidobacteria bacterium]|nr:hypothetical protein [Acidobacteriota bacterium]